MKDSTAMDDITERLKTGTEAIFSSNSYLSYLKTMSHFHHYSLNNNILIFSQKPNATYVAGYSSWQRNFHRNVKKGEKGIRILIPVKYQIQIEEDKQDNSENFYRIGGFRCAHVFDISQTTGEPLPTYMNSTIEGSVHDFSFMKKTLIMASPVPIHFETFQDSSLHGYYRITDKQIVIQSGMSDKQTIKTLIHEIAHAVLHGDSKDRTSISKEEREIQAESIAYCVSAHYGIDTSAYSFPYIAGWSSSKDMHELHDSLEIIRNASNRLIEIIDALKATNSQNRQRIFRYSAFLS
jgi:antirestriction protein ArdC